VRKRKKKLVGFYTGILEYEKNFEKYFSLDRWKYFSSKD
jgi:hypothetical protein